MDKIAKLKLKMIEYNEGDPLRIQHSIKVHSFAKIIAEMEHLDKETQYILEVAALMHDVGIRVSEKKFGKSNGKLQEQEGPKVAEHILKEIGFDDSVIRRTSYLVGHHHTYDKIIGDDYQILVEADFLVNLFEDNAKKEAIQTSLEKIFKTASGANSASTEHGFH